MTAADVGAACELAHAQGFRDRRRFYDFVLRTSTCRPLVGTIDGRLVATGLATVSSRLAGLARSSSRPSSGAGLGRAMTRRSASDYGLPVARRSRSKPRTRVGPCTSGWASASPPATTSSRPITSPRRHAARRFARSTAEPADLTDVFALDLQATAKTGTSRWRSWTGRRLDAGG